MLQNRRGSVSLIFHNVASRLEQQSVKKNYISSRQLAISENFFKTHNKPSFVEPLLKKLHSFTYNFIDLRVDVLL